MKTGAGTMVDSSIPQISTTPAQASHHLRMNAETFRALAEALYKMSARDLQTCSPRRFLTAVLSDPKAKVFGLKTKKLDKLCQLEKLTGAVKLSIRIDSATNDRLRELREYAEAKLGRPISVLEAVYVCIGTFHGS